MTLDQLRSFRAVIETGSFRAAATRVHRTQPAISHQIKALEREIGHVLIERKTRPRRKRQAAVRQTCSLLSDSCARLCLI